MKPLAEKMRPRALEDVFGQKEAIEFLEKSLKAPRSLLFFGPPGSGKTTLARIIAQESFSLPIYTLSAVSDGLAALRGVIKETEDKEKILLFIDEIHRWNKNQQDALLPHVETGQIVLIGATTENPSYNINPALRSRMDILPLKKLEDQDISSLLCKAEKDFSFSLDDDARKAAVLYAKGDARRVLNLIDRCLDSGQRTIDLKIVQQAIASKMPTYSRQGQRDEIVSSFIKSMRVSDPEGSLYWLARMSEGGEDPHFIARRMVIFASEDIGLADPQALPLAMSAAQAVQFVGEPECWINLSHTALYLALAEKSWMSYRSWLRAREIAREGKDYSTPKEALKENYLHPADSNDFLKTFLPQELEGKIFIDKDK